MTRDFETSYDFSGRMTLTIVLKVPLTCLAMSQALSMNFIEKEMEGEGEKGSPYLLFKPWEVNVFNRFEKKLYLICFVQ